MMPATSAYPLSIRFAKETSGVGIFDTPHGTASMIVDSDRAFLRIFAEPEVHPEDWKIVCQFIAMTGRTDDVGEPDFLRGVNVWEIQYAPETRAPRPPLRIATAVQIAGRTTVMGHVLVERDLVPAIGHVQLHDAQGLLGDCRISEDGGFGFTVPPGDLNLVLLADGLRLEQTIYAEPGRLTMLEMLI